MGDVAARATNGKATKKVKVIIFEADESVPAKHT
jgi:hypothetical protein